MKNELNKMRILITMVLLIITVAACRVGRDYKQPEQQLPTQFGEYAPSDSSIAGIEWKSFFTDATLQQLIDQALKGNYDLQIALKRIDEAHAYVKQARLNWTPSLNLQAAASTTIPSKNSLNGKSLESFIGSKHVEDYSLGASLSWEIDVWGKLRRQREAAIASYLQSYEGARAVQTQMVADIANSYFNLLMLDAQMKIAQRNLRLSDTIVQMMRLQKQAGQVTELAVQQADVQRQTTAKLLPQLQQQITIEENSLRILVGDFPKAIERPSLLKDIEVPENLPTGVPAEILSRRPDVRASEMALVAANAQVGVAQANMYPTLAITASGGVNAFKAAEWFTMPASLFGLAAGSLTQPVFQRRQLKTQKEVAEIQREQAVLQFRQTTLNAVGEVADALVRLDKLKLQKEIVAQQVETLHGAIKNAELLFKSGLADYLEVITAQGSLLRAELDLSDIERNRLAAMADLYRALGGGWK
jgi:outer membrane protein, multidrug efflux system